MNTTVVSRAAILLLACSVGALAQTPDRAAPAAAPPTSTTPAVPPSSTPPASPPTAVGADRKTPDARPPSKVLADPDTKIYSRCATGEEPGARDPGDDSYTPNPKAQVMTEEAARAKGFKEGAHRVPCK